MQDFSPNYQSQNIPQKLPEFAQQESEINSQSFNQESKNKRECKINNENLNGSPNN
jgi:hypothetical protein